MDAPDLIDLNCPACGRLARYPAIHAGTSVSCPACKHIHPLPAVARAAALPVAVAAAVPSAPAAPAVAAGAAESPAPAPGASDKVLFVCSACSYRARIPAQYVGMAVRCPSCDAAQIANPEEGATSTGRTVQISRMASSATTKGKTSKTMVRAGNILFTCGQCSFEAQLAKHYLGKAIRCPGCHAPQVVLDSSGTAPAEAPSEAAPPSDPRFICISCGYRARIPDQYMGLAVTCPKCETVQIASREDNDAPATGDTVSISRIKTSEPVERTPRAPGEEQVPFTCSSCGFKTQLGKSLSGMAIKCPGCQATQVVGGVGGPGAALSAGGSPPAAAAKDPVSAFAAALTTAGDKVRFTCTACGFKARIPSTYAGETIHCPGCNVVQMVLRSGPASTVASGNTQILSVVQTAVPAPAAPAAPAATAPPAPAPAHPAVAGPGATPSGNRARAAPSNTPEFGSPVIADPASAGGNGSLTVATPARGNPVIAPPAAAAAPAPQTARTAARSIPTTPSAAVAAAPVVVPGTAPGDELSFDAPAPPAVPASSRTGKVVRRNSQTPPPAAEPASRDDDAPPAKPSSGPKPSIPAKPAPAKPAAAAATPAALGSAGSDRTGKQNPGAAAAPPAREPVMAERAPKTSPVLIIMLALILVVLVGGGGLLGKMLMDIQEKLVKAQAELQSTNDKLQATNEKLTRAEQEAKKAQAEAEQARKAQEDEVKARKAADEKTADLQKQLAEQTAKAEAAKAEAAKAEAERAAAAKPDAPAPKPADAPAK